MKSYLLSMTGLGAVLMAKNAETGNAAPQGENLENAADTSATQDVNEDALEDITIQDLMTVASLGARPQPKLDGNGKPETVKVGDQYRVVYPDQDLYVIGGRATGYCFVETDKGTSLELHGDFSATVFVPNQNGEVDLVHRGSRCILPGSAEKTIVSKLEAAGFPVGMTGDIQTNEVGVKRTAVTKFADDQAVVFSFIVAAQSAPNTPTGYAYKVRMVTQARKEASQAEMLMAQAMKKRKVMQLAAPGSKHAE